MCGITGARIKNKNHKYFELLQASDIRGQDDTGIAMLNKLNGFHYWHWPVKASLIGLPSEPVGYPLITNGIVIGQNRLAIFGLTQENNQPLIGEKYALVHNGNLLDFEKEFKEQNLKRQLQVDSELILRLLDRDEHLENIYKLKGNFACLALDKERELIIAFCRDKPLWYYEDDNAEYFFSTDRIGKKVFGDKQFYELENEELKIV